MKKTLLLSASLLLWITAYGVNVSFSANGNRESSSTHVVPGSLPYSFTPDKMDLNDKVETYMFLKGTANEFISFKGNWEYDQSTNSSKPNWTPMSDIPPFKFKRNMSHTYHIRCTTKPAYPLIISSSTSVSTVDVPIQ